MGDLVLSELGGQSRSIRRISEYLSRDNRESRLVDLTNMVPGHRSRAGDEPGGLRASRHRETVNVERTITDDRPIRAGNDLVDDDASCERLSGAILGDGQRQGERIRATSSEMTAWFEASAPLFPPAFTRGASSVAVWVPESTV